MEQRAGIKYCVKLKKTTTETFEILKSEYTEECLSSTCVLKWQKRFQEGLKNCECKNHGRKQC
jgi:hypothetical protein